VKSVSLSQRIRASLSGFWRLRTRLQDPLVAFVCLALIFGLLFCVVSPPFFVLDESLHFSHAYQVSQGQLRPQKLSPVYYGGTMPQNVNDSMLKSLGFRTVQPNFRTTFIADFQNKAPAHDSTAPVPVIFNSTAVYSPVPYLPQATGILVGRVLRLPPVFLLYLGRLFNLLVWIVLVAMAIRFLPFGKWALVVIALLPTSLFQAASVSADALTTGLAFLATAMICKYVSEKKLLQNKQYMLLFLVMVLLALTKQSYFCFVLLVLALPWAKFRSRREYLKKTVAIIAVSLLLAAGWSLSVRKIDIMLPVLPNHPPINTAAQLRSMVTQPWHFGFATWNSYLTGRADTTVITFVGQFGRIYDLQLPFLVVVLAYVLVFIVLLSDETISKLKDWRRLKTVSAIVLFLTFFSITAILYITYNVHNNHFVDGIQARYFLPLMILLIPLAKLRKSHVLRLQAKPTLFLVGSTLLLIISLLMMIHRFYYAFA